MQTHYLHLYWPFRLKKGYQVLATDILNQTHYALVDSVLNDNFSESYYFLVDPNSRLELGWFRRKQIKRRVINITGTLSYVGM